MSPSRTIAAVSEEPHSLRPVRVGGLEGVGGILYDHQRCQGACGGPVLWEVQGRSLGPLKHSTSHTGPLPVVDRSIFMFFQDCGDQVLGTQHDKLCFFMCFHLMCFFVVSSCQQVVLQCFHMFSRCFNHFSSKPHSGTHSFFVATVFDVS